MGRSIDNNLSMRITNDAVAALTTSQIMRDWQSCGWVYANNNFNLLVWT